jgi:ferredoxin
MKILYFSSTGNCLYVAKQLGGERYSIPKLISENEFSFKDNVIGVIFPIYGLCIPPYIEDFLTKIQVECDYLFAIATYGFFPGAACSELNKLSLKNGRTFDYINRIKMAENCLTFADMKGQKGDSESQQKQIKNVLKDLENKRHFIRKDSFFNKIMTAHHKKNFEYPTGIGITEKISVNDSCAGCGICTKICPTANITIKNGKPSFGHNCISCGGCIQNCPNNAIHHKEEKSSARYRNPHIKIGELFSRN